MTIYIDDDKIADANARCNTAILELKTLALKTLAYRYLEIKSVDDYNRVMGKIEGVKLAQSYFNECLKDN